MNENIIGDREYTVGSLKEFLNSSWIDDDMPVKLNMNQWNFIKLYPKFSVKQLTSCGEPYINLGCREMDEDYNMIWEKWRDRGIENNKLRKENRQLKCLIDDYESREEHDKETINDLHKKGVSILFVSHHKDDLESADNIYFIEDGKIMPLEEELKRGHHHVNL